MLTLLAVRKNGPSCYNNYESEWEVIFSTDDGPRAIIITSLWEPDDEAIELAILSLAEFPTSIYNWRMNIDSMFPDIDRAQLNIETEADYEDACGFVEYVGLKLINELRDKHNYNG